MPQILLKLTLFLSLFALGACQDTPQDKVDFEQMSFKQLRQGVKGDPLDDVRRFNLAHPSGRILKTVLLVSPREQEVGLSGVRPDEFGDNEAALFWYEKTSAKRFWMPDTYFNLDIIFLDENLKIIAIESNMQAHPGMVEPPPIQYTRTIEARHVLEIRAKSDLSKALKNGDQFQVLNPLSLSQIESKIRQRQ